MKSYHFNEILINFKDTLLDKGKERIFGLDFLRALAILLVLISHGRHYIGNILGRYTEYLSIGGYLGVELFFVLSGFLIGGILLKIFEKKDKFITISDIKNFWIRRWFRTLPNYYLVLLLNCVIISLYLGYFHFDLRYLLFLQNFLTPAMGNMNYAQSWSLTVEEWFYLVTPVILFLSVKLFNYKVNKCIIIAILFLIISIPLLKLFYLFFVGNILEKGDKLDFNALRIVAILRLDSILYGVLISYINYYYRNLLMKIRNLLFVAGMLSLFGIGTILILQIDGFKTSNTFDIIFTSLGSFGLSLLLPYFNNARIIKNNIISDFITLTSVISYSLYLVHFSFVAFLLYVLDFNYLFSFFLFWFLSYLISSLLYYIFESRMTKFRELFSNKEKSKTKYLKTEVN